MCAEGEVSVDNIEDISPSASPLTPLSLRLDQFCPDELDDCQPKLPLGSACQLNRDGECIAE